MMRILADENISSVIIAKLRATGTDVRAVIEWRAGASDAEVLGMASAENRIILTEDRDFGELVVRRKQGLAGVILLELGRLSDIAAADLVTKVLKDKSDRLVECFVVVEPGRVRIRPLT